VVFFLCLTNVAYCDTLLIEVVNLAAVFGFRLPKDLREYLEKQAAVNRTSIGHYIVMLIDKDKNRKEEQHGNRQTETVTD